MDTFLSIEWNSSVEEKIIEWNRGALSSLLQESPDDELVSYITVMVGNKKKMSEIHNELKEFIDEELSSKFVQSLTDVISEMNIEGKEKSKNIRSIPKSVISADDKLGKALSSGRQRTSDNKKDDHTAPSQSKGLDQSPRLLQNALTSTREPAAKGPSRFVTMTDSHQQHQQRNKRGLENNYQRNGPVVTNASDVGMKKMRGDNGPQGSQNIINVPDQFLESMKHYSAMSGFRSLDDMMKAYQSGAIPPMMIPPFMMGFPPLGGPLSYPPNGPGMPGPGPMGFHPMGPEFPPHPMGFPMWIPPSDMPQWQPYDGFRGHQEFRGRGGGRFPGRGRGYGPPTAGRGVARGDVMPSEKAPTAEIAQNLASTTTEGAAHVSHPPARDVGNADESSTPAASNDRFSGRGRGFAPRGRGRAYSGRSYGAGRTPYPAPGIGGPKNKVWVRDPDMENPLVANR